MTTEILDQGPESFIKATDIPDTGLVVDTDLELALSVADEKGLHGVLIEGTDDEEDIVCSIRSTLTLCNLMQPDTLTKGDIVRTPKFLYNDNPEALPSGYTGPIAQVLQASGTATCIVASRRLFGVIAASNIDADSLRSGVGLGRLIYFSISSSMFSEGIVKGGRFGGKVNSAELEGNYQMYFDQPKLHGPDKFSDQPGPREISKSQLEALLRFILS